MNKLNCWEFMKCSRETDGTQVAAMGICPAVTDTSCNGLNGGKNGGRICWALAGTFCGSKVQGTFAEKRNSCLTCDFFKTVKVEEGVGKFIALKPGQKYNRRIIDQKK